MDRLTDLKQRYQSLPSLLRLVTLPLLILGAVVVITPLVPGMRFNLDGVEFQWRELWETRLALALLVLGSLMFLAGIGTLLARPWARPMLLALPFIQVIPFYLAHWVFGAPAPIRSISVTTYLFLCVVWAAIAAVYLYGRSAVRKHFAGTA